MVSLHHFTIPEAGLTFFYQSCSHSKKSVFCKDIMLPNNNDSFQVLLQRGVLLAKETTQEVCILSQRPAIVEYYFHFTLDIYIFHLIEKKETVPEVRFEPPPSSI